MATKHSEDLMEIFRSLDARSKIKTFKEICRISEENGLFAAHPDLAAECRKRLLAL